MSQRFTLTVHVETERTGGKFASREDITQELVDNLEAMDPGALYGLGVDGESEYEVVGWEVEAS